MTTYTYEMQDKRNDKLVNETGERSTCEIPAFDIEYDTYLSDLKKASQGEVRYNYETNESLFKPLSWLQQLTGKSNKLPDRELNLTVNFASLQRISLYKLQKELVDLTAQLLENDPINEGLLGDINQLMVQYTQAVRDWEFMVEHKAKAGTDMSRDLFIISSSRRLSNTLMHSAGLFGNHFYPHDEWHQLPGWQRRYMNATTDLETFLRRFMMAIFGGVALVVPMLIMVLAPGKTTALVTTVVCTFVFAAFAAKFSEATAPELTVAAYAAVLVVFVGANLTPSK